MKKTIVVSGIIVACLVLFLVCAGCTSQSQGTSTIGGQQTVTTPQAPEQNTPQVTATVAETSTAVSDQGLVSDDSSDAVAQAEAMNTTQASAAPDTTDFGDIMP
ncbi:hypothetical protein [Methanoregula sp.]|uniref:hypothetical protein n=1 Tax=Methanoregula sp. TaxID=2052170 RepID=UPI002C0EFD5C|nr:hypothetical protein [Methanoregula sp.]HVP96953.1 hypothetical protein [Methanoregula sp.]